jgi:hypothetical protein
LLPPPSPSRPTPIIYVVILYIGPVDRISGEHATMIGNKGREPGSKAILEISGEIKQIRIT